MRVVVCGGAGGRAERRCGAGAREGAGARLSVGGFHDGDEECGRDKLIGGQLKIGSRLLLVVEQLKCFVFDAFLERGLRAVRSKDAELLKPTSPALSYLLAPLV